MAANCAGSRSGGGFNSSVRAVFAPGALIAVCLAVALPVGAHDVPDGVVYRGIQVVVWSDWIEVRYQLGLSDNMIQQELRRLTSPAAPLPDEPGEALRTYGELMVPVLPQKMSLTLDAQPRSLSPRRTTIVRQPHCQIELTYRADFSSAEAPAHLLLVDDNFAAVPGYHFAAIKGRGSVEILDSNVVPVLSRLSRIPDTAGEAGLLLEPMRRVEALIGSTGSPDGSPEPQPIRPEARPPAAARLADNATANPPAEATAPATPPSAGGDSAVEADDAIRREDAGPRWLWLLAGGGMILGALLWTCRLARSTRQRSSPNARDEQSVS